MLVAQNVLLLLIAEVRLGGTGGVGGSTLADATSAHEYLGLQQKLALAGFALHVVHRIVVFHIGVEAEDHRVFLSARMSSAQFISRLPQKLARRLTLRTFKI